MIAPAQADAAAIRFGVQLCLLPGSNPHPVGCFLFLPFVVCFSIGFGIPL